MVADISDLNIAARGVDFLMVGVRGDQHERRAAFGRA
jgi:hypothetical protein